MDVQRWILGNVLPHVKMHPSSFAYQSQKSIVHCAERHVGARWLVKLDLHDFFGRIREKRVYEAFHGLGYSKLLSLELARLCTRADGPRDAGYRNFDKYQVIRSYVVGQQGFLPQGAPTSGALANLIATPLDGKLSEVAHSNGLSYTRYSDDLTFSGVSFGRDDARLLIAQVRKVVHEQKFTLHERKIRVIPPGARHVVLGLLVDVDRVRLLPEFKQRIRVHIRGVKCFGIVNHAEHRKFDSVLSFINHVDGCIAFAVGIEPSFAVHAREDWNAALQDSGFASGSEWGFRSAFWGSEIGAG